MWGWNMAKKTENVNQQNQDKESQRATKKKLKKCSENVLFITLLILITPIFIVYSLAKRYN